METKFGVQTINIEWSDEGTGWEGKMEVQRGVEGVQIYCKVKGNPEGSFVEFPVDCVQLLIDAFDSLGVR